MIPTRIAGTGLSVILSIMMIGAGSIPAAGQISGSTILGAYRNSIPTAVPFLLIAPDARSSALGDGGVASSPDVHSQHWNVARYSLTDDRAGFAFTYAPWLTNLLPDISHFYTSGFYRLGELQALSGSVRYFTTGTILFAGLAGGPNTLFQPREYAFDAGYSRQFSDHLSGGIALRYIYSRLSPSVALSTGDFSHPGTTIAGDLGLYYQKELSLVGKTGEWALGMLISNMGPTVQYAQGIDSHPLPTNLRLGGRMTLNLGENSRLSFLTDLNKLMAPHQRTELSALQHLPVHSRNGDGRSPRHRSTVVIILQRFRHPLLQIFDPVGRIGMGGEEFGRTGSASGFHPLPELRSGPGIVSRHSHEIEPQFIGLTLMGP